MRVGVTEEAVSDSGSGFFVGVPPQPAKVAKIILRLITASRRVGKDRAFLMLCCTGFVMGTMAHPLEDLPQKDEPIV